MSNKYNDINLKEWKNYPDIETNSLWIIKRRDKSGAHNSKYHGNFVPQIPHQLLLRYTKKGDWVLDPFSGSGTTLIEAQRLERNSIGIEIQKDVADESQIRIDSESKEGVVAKVISADSTNINMENLLNKFGISKVQFVLMHPPYWDIIKFSDKKGDLSNAKSLSLFKRRLRKAIDNTTKVLEKNRYCAIVIGDKYSESRITPLGFECMNLFIEKGFILKAIIVKNFGDTEGKENMQSIWRYRALSADYYIFKHEYIMVFKKVN